MDLSYRAQLRGWRFVYLPEIAAPAELPVEMSSFKSQQFRWAKGSVQVAMKLLPTILRSKTATFAQKSEAFFHLTNNLAYPLLLRAVAAAAAEPGAAPAPRLARGADDRSAALLRHHAQHRVVLSRLAARDRAAANPGGKTRTPWWVIKRLPLVMSIGIGLCVNQTRAVLEALFGRETEFVRTPKHGIRGRLEAWSSKKYRAAKSITPFLELGMAAYFAVAMVVALDHGHYLSMPFLALFLYGFGYVGWVSLWQGGVGVALARLRRAPHPGAPSCGPDRRADLPPPALPAARLEADRPEHRNRRWPRRQRRVVTSRAPENARILLTARPKTPAGSVSDLRPAPGGLRR